MIDADLHNDPKDVYALFSYLSDHWREQVENTLFKGPVDKAYPPNAPISGKPVTTVEQLREEALDPRDVEIGILTCAYAVDSLRHPDAAIALASAVNDWQVAEWLDKEPRLRASIVVPSQLPQYAAREIDRVGAHKGFVQVLLPARAHLPWGNRIHEPLWDAVARNDLVAALHFGGSPGNPPTPEGWPSFYLEEFVAMAQVFASQMTSIISEGVFDRHENQRVVFVESGFTWVPAHCWRFDKEWRNLRRLVPWVKRAPSEYVKEHMRFTLQPIDAPGAPQLLQAIEQMGSDELVLYASDHPHKHALDPEQILADLPAGLARKMRAENARAFYRL